MKWTEILFQKKKKCFITVSVLAILLTGCASSKEAAMETTPYHIVTQIEVAREQGSRILLRRYRSAEKMEKLLDYLRSVSYTAVSTSPPQASTFRAYRITVQMADGSQTTYYQLSDSYLLKNSGDWKHITSEQAKALEMLLLETPSDW